MDANSKVTVIGAGLMGHALALVHAAGGHQVKMQDVSEAQLKRGVELIASALQTMVDAGAIDAAHR
jgi:3-hydroxybutyryl-CoA dehydrogenase